MVSVCCDRSVERDLYNSRLCEGFENPLALGKFPMAARTVFMIEYYGYDTFDKRSS